MLYFYVTCFAGAGHSHSWVEKGRWKKAWHTSQGSQSQLCQVSSFQNSIPKCQMNRDLQSLTAFEWIGV